MSSPAREQSGSEPPTNQVLRQVLGHASEVTIVEAAPGDADRNDAARVVVSEGEIAGLAELLAIVDGGTGDTCRCPGHPTILLRGAAGRQIAQWTLHHGKTIRGIGYCDAELRDGPAVTRWLADRGLSRSLMAEQLLERERADREERRARWAAAAPRGLAEAAEAASLRKDGAEARLAQAVLREYPEREDRVRALLTWAGFPARHDGGTPWHEAAPQRMLLGEPPEAVFAALTMQSPTPAQLDGAAELFTCWEWGQQPRPAIPEPLRTVLVDYVQRTGTEPMKFRISAALQAPGT